MSQFKNNKRGVSEHEGVEQSPQKQQRMISFPNAKPNHVIKGGVSNNLSLSDQS